MCPAAINTDLDESLHNLVQPDTPGTFRIQRVEGTNQ